MLAAILNLTADCRNTTLMELWMEMTPSPSMQCVTHRCQFGGVGFSDGQSVYRIFTKRGINTNIELIAGVLEV